MGKHAKVRGADRVASTMAAAAHDLETMDDATDDYADALADAARANAPVRTGRLRQGITIGRARVEATAGHSAVIEYGSRRKGITARRYMARAVESTERDCDRIYTRGADKICDQIKGA